MDTFRVVWWFLGKGLRKPGHRQFVVNLLGAVIGFLLFFGLFSAYYFIVELGEQVDSLSNRVGALEFLLNQERR